MLYYILRKNEPITLAQFSPNGEMENFNRELPYCDPDKRLCRPDRLNQILSPNLDLSLSPKDHPAGYGILVCSVQDLVLLAEGNPDVRRLTAEDLVNGKAGIVRAPIGTSLTSIPVRALPPEPKALLFAGRGALHGHRIREPEVLAGDTALFPAVNFL